MILAKSGDRIFKGFEARVAGTQPNKKNERLAADSDFYKWIEGASYVFAREHDKDINTALDHAAYIITWLELYNLKGIDLFCEFVEKFYHQYDYKIDVSNNEKKIDLKNR